MRSMLIPAFWGFLFAALLFAIYPAAMVLAQTTPPNAASGQNQKTLAENFVQDLGTKAIGDLADKNMTPDQRSQKYRDLLQSSFDLPTIGHFVLGRAWNSATPQQQQEFMNLFEQSVLKTYGDRLNFYSGESFMVTGERPEDNQDTVVNSKVTHPDNSQAASIDWRVRQTNGKMAVVDVVVEGVSQSVTQRDEYASILQRNNGNVDALLAMMRQRAQQQGAPAQSP